jgi:hypothetical protein
MSEALSEANSQGRKEPGGASVTELLALASRIEGSFQRAMQSGLLVMIYSLTCWAMAKPSWMRFALVPVFSVCSLVVIRFGGKQ